MSTFLEKPAVVKTRGMVQAVAPFFVFLPYIAGFITLLTAVLGPAMIPNRNLSLLTITALPGVAQDPDSHAGIWFGQFSA